MIQVANLTKKFPKHTAVDGISFEVEKGDIVGFLGPNGAGKTTTIRMLTGFLPPTSGTATIAGYNVTQHSIEVRKKIGYMPENVPLYFDMRVKEYLRFRGRLKGLTKPELKERLSIVLELCNLHEMRRRMISTLSKGYRQRVGLADALIANPDILILDEPTNGLDPNQIYSIRQLIRDLGKDHTILLSTHILPEVETTCNKVIIIDEGKIKAAQRPETLITSMRTAGRISLEVKADPELIEKEIAVLPAVRSIRHKEKDGHWECFDIYVEAGTDTREHLSSIIIKNQWPMRQLYRHQFHLEDIFRELTHKD